MDNMANSDANIISEKYTTLAPLLDERARRLWAATEARAIGWGGISRVSEATGLSRITIRTGLDELHSTPHEHPERVRKLGGGRKALADHAPRAIAPHWVIWHDWGGRIFADRCYAAVVEKIASARNQCHV
jgi:hypothetical protein